MLREFVWRSFPALLAGAALLQPASLLAQDPPPPEPELVASTDPRTPEEEARGFHLPPGFEAQLVACEPDIHKPMNLAFDALGRLWVTSSLEYPYPAKEGEQGRDAVVILEDFGPDGRARKVTTFADGLNIPIGVLPITPRQALVHSIPNIYLMTDDDGDGRADRREVAYAAIGFKDTHGMASSFSWGFDGWIYGTHGFANDSTIAGRDGQSIQLNSGNTYRLRPDGQHIEAWTRGQVNPFGLAFTPSGDLFSADCHSRPIMMLLRGAYYPSFGKPHDGLGFGPEIMTHDHGSTGIAGIVHYAAEQFPAAFREKILIGNVVTSRINLDRLDWTGSSPKAVSQPDFLWSDDPWFRPVDLELGPDGALYVADFYNRIIGHYEVPLTHPGRDRERGRIWRIVYRGPEPHAEPASPHADWTAATPEELYEDLAHANLAVRIRAGNELSSRDRGVAVEVAARATADPGSPARRLHGLHVLARLEAVDPMPLVAAIHDLEDVVRTHALRIAADRSEWTGLLDAHVAHALQDDDPFVRRAAADALGRHPDASTHLRPLLAARSATDPADEQLVHTIRMALRDQLRPDAAWDLVANASLTDAEKALIADVAPGIPSLRSVRYLLAYLAAGAKPDPPTMSQFVHHIGRHGDGATDQELIAFLASPWTTDGAYRADVLRESVLGLQERGASLPEAGRALALDLGHSLVASTLPHEQASGCQLATSLKLAELFEPIAASALEPARAEDQRSRALAALQAIDPSRAVATLGTVLADSTAPAGLRDDAANLLGQTGSGDSRTTLLSVLATAPARLQATTAAALANSKEGAVVLLDAVAGGKASPRLLQERAVDLRLRGAKIDGLDERLAELTAGLEPADKALQERIERHLARLSTAPGDATRGAAVFQKHCATCHQIGGQGARIGPQLDGVGVRGSDRILEDVLDPNRNVDQAFRSVTLALSNGQVLSGLPLREEGEIQVLADSQGQEQRVPRSDIEERTVSSMSLMPSNLADQIPDPEFADLVQFLLSNRETPRPAP